MGCSSSVPINDSAPKYEVKRKSIEGDPFVYLPDAVATILTTPTGAASKEECAPMTMLQLYTEVSKVKANVCHLAVEKGLAPVKKKGDPVPPALKYPEEWTRWTFKESYDTTITVAKGFMGFGAVQHDAIVIYGFNSPEWHFSALAAMCGGFKAAGIYPTDTPEQIVYKAGHSGGAVIVVETESQLKVFTDSLDKLPRCKAIICWTGTDLETHTVKRSDGSEVVVGNWKELIDRGNNYFTADFDTAVAKIQPGHCCALVYTSGTTGQPKAVMISHDNFHFESKTAARELARMGVAMDPSETDRIISYLPLSHVAGMLIDIILPVASVVSMPGSVTVNFARPYDLKFKSLKDRLQAVQPTFFLGVPRVWEIFMETLKAVGASTTGMKKKASTWAKNKCLQYQKNALLGGSGSKPAGHALAAKLMSVVKGKMGLQKMKLAATGAAPISKEVLEYFGQIDINICEIYGMSETSGAHTMSTNSTHLWASCGFTMDGCETKCFEVDPDDNNKKSERPLAKDIFSATEEEQGEICMRGRNIMMGYMAQPEFGEEHVQKIIQANKSTFDSEGWLHSGDKGCIGENGMAKITGRYKELIIGAGGENIAPVPIEDTFKKIAPAVANIVMIGDHRKFNVCVVTLKAEGATGELPGNDNLAGVALQVNSDVTTISGACKDPIWEAYITDALKELNKTVPNNPSKIQRFTILPTDVSVATGELTPTLKLKRSVLSKKYATTIDRLYEAKDCVYVPYVADV